MKRLKEQKFGCTLHCRLAGAPHHSPEPPDGLFPMTMLKLVLQLQEMVLIDRISSSTAEVHKRVSSIPGSISAADITRTRGKNLAEDVDRDVTSLIDDVGISRFVLDLKNALGLVGLGGEFLEEVGIGVAELQSTSRIWGIMIASKWSNCPAQQSSNAAKIISKDCARVN